MLMRFTYDALFLALALLITHDRKIYLPKGIDALLRNINTKLKMKLEVKVLDYINSHHHGVRVSDMELPLGENRMKLGYVAKNLLEEGKIIKIRNEYFPKYNTMVSGIKRALGP